MTNEEITRIVNELEAIMAKIEVSSLPKQNNKARILRGLKSSIFWLETFQK